MCLQPYYTDSSVLMRRLFKCRAQVSLSRTLSLCCLCGYIIVFFGALPPPVDHRNSEKPSAELCSVSGLPKNMVLVFTLCLRPHNTSFDRIVSSHLDFSLASLYRHDLFFCNHFCLCWFNVDSTVNPEPGVFLSFYYLNLTKLWVETWGISLIPENTMFAFSKWKVQMT